MPSQEYPALSTPDQQVIAYLTSCFPRTSDTFIQTEIAHLRKQGFDVRTFAVRRPSEAQRLHSAPQSEHSSTEYVLEAGGAKLLAELARCMFFRPRRFLKTLRLMLRLSAPGLGSRVRHLVYLFEASRLAGRMQRLGVRHLHNHIGENSATVAALASTLSGIPFSQTIHGPGIFFHPQKWALGEKIALATFTACISRFCLSQCMHTADIAAWNRLELIRCCVGEDFEVPATAEIPEDAGFLFIGRLCHEKGLPILLDAMRILVDRHPEVCTQIVGDGPLRVWLQERIGQLGLQKNVELLGWKTSAGVRQALVSARALVLPSFAEGLPVVLMESMALRRPVITTRIAGIPELVEHGIHGWLIEPASVQSLANAMQHAYEATAEQLHEMGRAGAERVQQQHCASTESAKLAKLIRRSISATQADFEPRRRAAQTPCPSKSTAES